MTNETNWEALYQSGDMRWEKGRPAPGLVSFLKANPRLKKGRVLVPGCGTGHDVRAWAQAGFAATGLDLAPSAIRLAQGRTKRAGLHAEFRLENFLETKPESAAERFDWIFEHTLFCAIQPKQRAAYVRALLRWLQPGGQFLAIHYMLREGKEPPFGATQEELMERFAPHFELLQGWVPESHPGREGKELMLWWKRKAAEKQAARH